MKAVNPNQSLIHKERYQNEIFIDLMTNALFKEILASSRHFQPCMNNQWVFIRCLDYILVLVCVMVSSNVLNVVKFPPTLQKTPGTTAHAFVTLRLDFSSLLRLPLMVVPESSAGMKVGYKGYGLRSLLSQNGFLLFLPRQKVKGTISIGHFEWPEVTFFLAIDI